MTHSPKGDEGHPRHSVADERTWNTLSLVGHIECRTPTWVMCDECDVTHHYHSLLTTPTIDDSPVPPRSPSCRPQGIKTQEWPEHRSHEEQHPKPGTSPSTTQWLEVEALMPIFGVYPTSFHCR